MATRTTASQRAAAATADTQAAVARDGRHFDARKALHKALGGGLSGAAAMAIQVVTLMPLRTAMNWQYRHGATTTESIRKLYAEDGIRRFYRGIAPALVQAPLSRFGDTASNAFALTLLADVPVPVALKTVLASTLAAGFRIALVPVDTLKTVAQVEGAGGFAKLAEKVARHGPSSMFHGALASAGATFVGHLPWFATFNTLQEMVPRREDTVGKLARNAAIGFVSSVTSDTISNSIRVIKTYRQTTVHEVVPYSEVVKRIIASHGISSLLFRGLGTRILANGLQGLLFSVLWRAFDDAWAARDKQRGQA